MDTRLSGSVPVASFGTGRSDPVPVRQAVHTDLPPPVAVSAQVGADQTRWSKDRRSKESDPVVLKKYESSIELDRETGDLIYKVVDSATRSAVSQYPYEASLKLRAYIKAEDERNGKIG
ncbi:MAG: hypothetical protein CFE31_12670 [Rhizobiales bacterium PAR1]|nr:MAG: hypothetical protein CFE31_12670 [Rhizobiales bacterium PAR1]